ncbi:helicase associated domain-containing protein [Streptomyces yangpuensis]|uniref:helicase associated domain-containing protein n=1 Tax=Streptomyces yangpuensis TaxID=1648182 RepID=UPI00366220EF
MTAEESVLVHIEPSVIVHGMDIGTWLERQRRPAVWAKLADGQRERLQRLGIQPEVPKQQKAPATARKGSSGSFERGAAALAQYAARTGSVTVPRTHVEVLDSGAEVKLGIWLTNTKSRRAELGTEQLKALADLGLDWAI